MVNLLLSEGALELLEFLKNTESGHFNDFRSIKNTRTNKQLSANTISSRLKELVEKGAIERVVSSSKTGRNVVAYQITAKGKKALELAHTFEGKLSELFYKN